MDNYASDADAGYTDTGVGAALISADKVKGTDVYNDSDERLGAIDSILIDKVTGEVAYVVMSFGGFLGIGEKYHPLPWHVLEYDTVIGGYRVDLDRATLAGAPSFSRDEVDAYDYDRDASGVNSYYGSGTRSADYDDDQVGGDLDPATRRYRKDTHTDAAGNPGFYSAEQQAARNVPDGGAGATPGRQTLQGAQSGTASQQPVSSDSTAGLTGSSTGTADHWKDDPANR